VKFPEGKSVKVMHREYGFAESTLRWWARENNVPFFGEDGVKVIYIFDKESEERFKNRKDYPGRIRDEGVVKLADQFGVSKQCVRNWAEKQGIPKDERGFIIGKKEIKLFEHRNDEVKRGRPRKISTELKLTEGQIRNEERVLIQGKKPRGRPRKDR
jgi:ribosomal protein S14